MTELICMVTVSVIGFTAEGMATGDRRHQEEVPTPRGHHQQSDEPTQGQHATSPFGNNALMIPTPGTFALLGIAGLATVTRRRS
ncbi:MAG: hypothetical protein AAGB34_03420 [Planctomycetota bacterium]